MSFKLRILIIGSLYWETHPVRDRWRKERLLLDEQFSVGVPIRYGRFAVGRNSYTMVFSPCCQLGPAKIVRCKLSVSSGNDLICEAEELWKAESKKDETHGKVSGDWGCVALVTNPKIHVPEEILDGWASHVNGQEGYGTISGSPSEGVVVTKRGSLLIDWPQLSVGGSVPLDMLLATATKPTLEADTHNYPLVSKIVNAWKVDTKGNVNYFLRNRESEIFTFQDREINELLGYLADSTFT